MRICMYVVCICYQNMGAEKWKKVMIWGVVWGQWWRWVAKSWVDNKRTLFARIRGEKAEKLVTHHFRQSVCEHVCASMSVIISLHFAWNACLGDGNGTHSHTHSVTFYLNEQRAHTQILPHTKFLIRTRFSIMLITFYNSRVFFSCALLHQKYRKSFAMNAYNLHTHAHTYKRIFLSRIHLLKRGYAVQFHLLPILLVHVYCIHICLDGCIDGWYECECECGCLCRLCTHTTTMPALHFHFRLISLPIHCSTRFHQNIFI